MWGFFCFWRRRQQEDLDMSVLGLPGMLKDSESVNAPYFDNQHSSSSLMTTIDINEDIGCRSLIARRREQVLRYCLLVSALMVITSLVIVIVLDGNNNRLEEDINPTTTTSSQAEATTATNDVQPTNNIMNISTIEKNKNTSSSHQIFHDMAPRTFEKNLFGESSRGQGGGAASTKVDGSAILHEKVNSNNNKKPLALIHIGPPMTFDVEFQKIVYESRTSLQEIGWDMMLPIDNNYKSGNCFYEEIVVGDDDDPDDGIVVPSHICSHDDDDTDDSYLSTWKDLIQTTYHDTNLILSAPGFASIVMNEDDTTTTTAEQQLSKLQSLLESTHDIHILAVFRYKLDMGKAFYKYMADVHFDSNNNNNNHGSGGIHVMSEHRIFTHPPKWMYLGNGTLPLWSQVFSSNNNTPKIHLYSHERLQKEQQHLFDVIKQDFFPELQSNDDGDGDGGSSLRKKNVETNQQNDDDDGSILEYSVRYLILEMIIKNNKDVLLSKQKQQIEECILSLNKIREIIKRLKDDNNTIKQKCVSKEHLDLWKQWTISELDDYILSHDNKHIYDTFHITRTFYPPYNSNEEEETWCEIDKSAYSERVLEDTIATVAGDCWKELLGGGSSSNGDGDGR